LVYVDQPTGENNPVPEASSVAAAVFIGSLAVGGLIKNHFRKPKAA
jgi:hypothetical protein